MKVTLFSKKIKGKNNTSFNIITTKIMRKDGTEVYARVRFNGCVEPELSGGPAIIEFEKGNANMSSRSRNVVDDDGVVHTAINYTLWIKNYKLSDEKFVDHSLDDFE